MSWFDWLLVIILAQAAVWKSTQVGTKRTVTGTIAAIDIACGIFLIVGVLRGW